MFNKRVLPLLVATAFITACASTSEQQTGSGSDSSVTSSNTSSNSRGTGDRSTGGRNLTGPGSQAGVRNPDKNSVYFDYDRDDIKAEYRAVLQDHAKYLQANPAVKVRIEGNADERGSREYNLALGQRRAEAVMKNLMLLGVPGSRLEAVSLGEEKPRRGGHDEGSWAENRRGDVVFDK